MKKKIFAILVTMSFVGVAMLPTAQAAELELLDQNAQGIVAYGRSSYKKAAPTYPKKPSMSKSDYEKRKIDNVKRDKEGRALADYHKKNGHSARGSSSNKSHNYN